MGKKIVILHGSPHKNGNTGILAHEFMRGALEAGNETTEFWLQGMDIHGCLGCYRGDSTRENPCIQQDDMQKIYPAMKEAQVVVMVSPLYYWNISGQLRTAMDRFLALEEKVPNLRGHDRAGILIMAAAGDEFQVAVNYYNLLMERLEWKNLGAVLAGSTYQLGDIVNHKDKLEEAHALGRSIG